MSLELVPADYGNGEVNNVQHTLVKFTNGFSINWSGITFIVTSSFPIITNGVATTNYAGQLSPGLLIRIAVSNVTLSNGAMLKPSISDEFNNGEFSSYSGGFRTPYYLVNITSEYPMSVNGSLVRNYVNYVRVVSVISVRVKSIPKYLGFVTLNPNA